MTRMNLPLLAAALLLACGDKAEETTTKPGPSADDGGGDDGADDGSADGADGSADGADGSADGADGGDDGSAAFFPQEGHWLYTGEGTLISDNCNYTGDAPSGTANPGFTLSKVGADRFTIVQDADASDVMGCSLTEPTFDCDDKTGSEPIPDVSADLVVTVNTTGTFSDATHTDLRFDLNLDCSGSDCELVEWYADISFPCQVAFSAVAVAE